MDLLLARMHTGSAPTSLISPATSGMMQLACPNALQQPGMPVVANDMQRVMQWAGTELSLRDQKASLSMLSYSIIQNLVYRFCSIPFCLWIPLMAWEIPCLEEAPLLHQRLSRMIYKLFL